MRCYECGDKLITKSRFILSFTPELDEESFRDVATSDGLMMFKSKKKARKEGKKLVRFDNRDRYICEIVIDKHKHEPELITGS